MFGVKGVVGIVGYGLVGSACAQRLRRAGFTVMAFDGDGARRAQMLGENVLPATSLHELAGGCETLVLAVRTREQVLLALALVGTLPREQRAPDLAVVSCAKLDPWATAEVAEAACAADVGLIELSISGTARQLAADTGVVLAGGEPGCVLTRRDLIDAIVLDGAPACDCAAHVPSGPTRRFGCVRPTRLSQSRPRGRHRPYF